MLPFVLAFTFTTVQHWITTRGFDPGRTGRDTLFVVDENFSKTLEKGTLVGGRLLPLPQYWITTGSCFPLTVAAAEMIDDELIPRLRGLARSHARTLRTNAKG